ncbi:NIPA-like protein, partial [Mucuna pruriens]
IEFPKPEGGVRSRRKRESGRASERESRRKGIKLKMNEDGVTSANLNPSLPKPPSSPPTPAASSAGASSPAVPANGDARRRDKSSADSRALLGSLLHGASVPSCRPWERGDLLRRLSTFKLAGKLAKVAGSLACAKRGWVNVDVAKIGCEICGAHLDFALPSASSFEAGASSEEFSEQLDRGHKVTCPWRGNSCPESLVQFPPTSPSALIGGFKDRCDGLLQFYSLPIVSSSAVEQMRVTHSPQIDLLLSQLQIQTAGELGCRGENVCGVGLTGEQAPHPYSYAQKLISLCGWEPRWLSNVLDCEEQSAESAKNDYSSDPAKGSAPVPAPSKKEFSTSSRKDTGDNDVLGSEFNCESRSPLLDCSLCGATVRVWDFLTAPRPVHLAPCGIDTPQTSKKIASTRGISAASGINEWAAADGVEKERTGDRDEATTSDKRQLVSNKTLDLSLKMASGPSCSPINLTLTPGHVQDAGEGKDLMIGRPSGSEVGDQAASYESKGPKARKRKLNDGGTAADRPHLNMQQADSAERTITDRDNNEVIGSEQYSAGPVKRARDTNLLETFQFPLRNSSDVVPSHSLDIQMEPDANITNQLNPEKDHAIGNPSTRDSTHASSIIAMNTVYHSSDDESMESVENFPVGVNDVNFASVDLNETSELNSSYQAQQSACFQPLQERAGGETGVSSSNACGEVLNTEILTAHGRDGPSFGISGGSVGMGASHEAEIHGTDVSVHRGDSLGDVEPIAEVIENQGQAGEFEPYHGLSGDFVPEEMSREGPQGDSQAVVSQSTARADSGSKVIASTKVESVESGEKTSSSMQMLGLENGAHPSLSCNAVVCSAYEVSKEEVTQTGKASHIDDGAYHESGHLIADVIGTPYRDNGNGGVEFDPIKLHNDYCPWVNGDVAAAGCDNPCSSSGVGNVALCGWQLTLDALDSFQSLGHLPVQTLQSESAASMCKGDRFTSSQKLLARNSYVRKHGRN